MDKWIEKASNIRNFAIKTILAVVGLIFVIILLYPFALERLYLTEKEATWGTEDWILSGFVLMLAGAAWKFNSMKDWLSNINPLNNDN